MDQSSDKVLIGNSEIISPNEVKLNKDDNTSLQVIKKKYFGIIIIIKNYQIEFLNGKYNRLWNKC